MSSTANIGSSDFLPAQTTGIKNGRSDRQILGRVVTLKGSKEALDLSPQLKQVASCSSSGPAQQLSSFGGGLADNYAQRLFEVAVDLCNMQTHRLVKAADPDSLAEATAMGIKPQEYELGGEKYLLWSLPNSYRFFGCADTPASLPTFAKQLSDSAYKETLCTSAVTEDTGFYQEATRVFLIMQVNPRHIVQCQEKDLRSPRFSENKDEQNTQWYEQALAKKVIHGHIHSAHLNFTQAAGQLPGSTALDRFNRLAIQISELPQKVQERLEKARLSKEQLLELAQQGSLLDPVRESINQVPREALERGLQQGGLLSDDLYRTGDPSKLDTLINFAGDYRLSFEEQRTLAEFILFQSLSPDENTVQYQKIKAAVETRYYYTCFQELVKSLFPNGKADLSPKTALLRATRLERFLKVHASMAPQANLLPDHILPRIKALHASSELAYISRENGKMKKDYDYLPSFEIGPLREVYVDEDTDHQEKIDKRISELQRSLEDVSIPAIYEELHQVMDSSAYQAKLQEELARLNQETASVQIPNYKRFIETSQDIQRKVVPSQGRKLEADLKLIVAFRQGVANLTAQVIRIILRRSLETLDKQDQSPCIRKVLAFLQGEGPSLSRVEAKQLPYELKKLGFDGKCEQGIEQLDNLLVWNQDASLKAVLSGEDLDIMPMSLNSLRDSLNSLKSQINRPTLQLNELMEAFSRQEKQLSQKDRKQAYMNLFGEDDPSGKYAITAKLQAWDHALRKFPTTTGKRPDRRNCPFVAPMERLLSPQQTTSQTHPFLSPWKFTWNEINLDLRASGGKQDGSYPTGLVVTEAMLKSAATTQDAQVKATLDYAKAAKLPVFLKSN